jgi:hypothetical protein
MASWLDRMVRRVRDASTTDEAMAVTRDYIDPNTGMPAGDNGGGPGDQDTHIHLHMNGKGEAEGGGMDATPTPMGGGAPMNGNGNGGGGDLAQLAARVAALEEMVQALADGNGDEEDVELEDPDTQDARRFKMRRRDAMRMRTGDEGAEIPVPERLGEDMVGETDLPGLEGLEQGSTNDARIRRARLARTRDSMDQEDLWSDLIANAEIIAPGTRIPTFDARLPMKSTAERLCKYRRLVMEKAFKDGDTAALIQDTVGIATFDGIKPLGCDSVKMAFNAVASAMAATNNRRSVRTVAATPTRDNNRTAGPPSIAQMNKDAKEFWTNQKSNGAIRH